MLGKALAGFRRTFSITSGTPSMVRPVARSFTFSTEFKRRGGAH